MGQNQYNSVLIFNIHMYYKIENQLIMKSFEKKF